MIIVYYKLTRNTRDYRVLQTYQRYHERCCNRTYPSTHTAGTHTDVSNNRRKQFTGK